MAGGARRLLDALFGEAFDLERRRRRRYLLLVMIAAVAAAAATVVLTRGGASPGSPAAAQGMRPGLTASPLPRAGDYAMLSLINGRLVASGGVDGSPLQAPGYVRLAHGRVVGNCTAAVIDAVTLRPSQVRTGNCGDPALYGEHVMALSVLAYRKTRQGNLGIYDVHIAKAQPGARDGYTLGPTVATFIQCSDCHDESIYGDGSLWVYWASGGGLLRISESTGKVVERWALPGYIDGLLAVDRDGLWLAQSVEGGYPGLHLTKREVREYDALYRVAPGMRTPQRVLTVGEDGANWILASGHTLWLDARIGKDESTTWILHGTHGPAVRESDDLRAGYDCTQFDGIQVTLARTSSGIYCVSIGSAPEGTTGHVLRIAPDLRSGRSVASTTFDDSSYYTPAVSYHGAFFFLNPANIYSASTTRLPGVLYRYTPRR